MAFSLVQPRRKKRFSLPKEMKLPALLSLLFGSMTGFVSIVMYPSMQPVVPLYYSLPQLDQQLVPKEFLFLLPVLSLTVFFVQIFVGKVLSQIDILMMKLLNWVSVLFTFLLFFALLRILVII